MKKKIAVQPKKIFRIGFLDNSTASGIAVLSESFRQDLHKLGWIEDTKRSKRGAQ